LEVYGDIAIYCGWWSSSEVNKEGAWYRNLYYGNNKVGRGEYYKSGGFSVRCLRD